MTQATIITSIICGTIVLTICISVGLFVWFTNKMGKW